MSGENTNNIQTALQQFSPITRRFLALALLFFAGYLLWILLLSPVTSQMGASLTKLEDARFQRMRLEQIQARPEIKQTEPVDAGYLAQAASTEEAQTNLQNQIAAIATQNSVDLMITARPLTKGSQLIAFDISASASETSITRFINNIERGNPAMRLRNWQIESASIASATPEPSDPMLGVMGDTVQFSGQLVGAWIKS